MKEKKKKKERNSKIPHPGGIDFPVGETEHKQLNIKCQIKCSKERVVESEEMFPGAVLLDITR